MINWIYSNNEDDTARYTLGKTGTNMLICIGINPSTAVPNETLDPTLRKVEKIALRNGYDGWVMLNVYPQRETNPDNIHPTINQEIHQENINAISQFFRNKLSMHIWAAWGDDINKRTFLKICLTDLIPAIGEGHIWLNQDILTEKQNPRHPLYIRDDANFIPFDIEGYLRN